MAPLVSFENFRRPQSTYEVPNTLSYGGGRRELLLTVRTEGDCALVRHKGQTIALTPPLRNKCQISTRLGKVDHDTIIGKQPRDVVVSSENYELRVQLPTLEEYIILSPRLVTPVRSALVAAMPFFADREAR